VFRTDRPSVSPALQLLNRDPKKRLGSKDDVEDIKSHPFFKELSWSKMLKKEIEVPYKPKVKASDDTSNFDNTFTNEPVVDSVVPAGTLSSVRRFFCCSCSA
jgi:serum/glucocorticoid-regulated kinase 2